MMMSKPFLRTSQQQPAAQATAGFTIVELMVATVVFAVILIVITGGIISFTKNYYRGVNSSTTQTVAANVINTVAQTVQLSKLSGKTEGTIAAAGNAKFLCLANKEFIYNPGVLDGTSIGAYTSGFYMIDTGGGCYTDAAYASSPGWAKRQDLLQPHMRVVSLTADKLTGGGMPNDTWNIGAVVAYGDDDLFCVPGASPGGCNSNTTLITFDNPNLQCKLSSGSQFCDVSSLSTSVQVRVQ